jgi:hypothetical protein
MKIGSSFRGIQDGIMEENGQEKNRSSFMTFEQIHKRRLIWLPHLQRSLKNSGKSLKSISLRADPQEEINLASTSSEELKKLREELEKYKHLPGSQELALEPAMIERLRALGYVR